MANDWLVGWLVDWLVGWLSFSMFCCCLCFRSCLRSLRSCLQRSHRRIFTASLGHFPRCAKHFLCTFSSFSTFLHGFRARFVQQLVSTQRSGLKSLPGQRSVESSVPLVPPSKLSVNWFALTGHCLCEDQMVRQRTGHPPSCAEVKKVKLLTCHTHGGCHFGLA